MINNEQNEDQFIAAIQNDEMTYVEYINQHDDDVRDEYEQYCMDKGLDPNSEDSAHSFIDYHEDELDASMEA